MSHGTLHILGEHFSRPLFFRHSCVPLAGIGHSIETGVETSAVKQVIEVMSGERARVNNEDLAVNDYNYCFEKQSSR